MFNWSQPLYLFVSWFDISLECVSNMSPILLLTGILILYASSQQLEHSDSNLRRWQQMFMGVHLFPGPKEEGVGVASVCRLQHSSRGCPWQTPVSSQEQQTNTSGKVLTLVEEYKLRVSAQPLLMLLKTEERSLCWIQMSHKWRGFTQLHSDRPPSHLRHADSLFWTLLWNFSKQH